MATPAAVGNTIHAGISAIRLSDCQMVFTGMELPALHHHPASRTGMQRIVNRHLATQTPGSLSLARGGLVQLGSHHPVRSSKPPNSRSDLPFP